MSHRIRIVAALVALLCQVVLSGRQAPADGIVPPDRHFGFRMGTDGQLASWSDIQTYFKAIDEASDRVELVDVGPTTDGNRLLAAIVSAPENIQRLKQIQATNLLLADPRKMSETEAVDAAKRQPVVVAIGCSIHAAEIGATQGASELLYNLATSDDPRTDSILRNVVLILIPSLNPDGYELVFDWYRKTRGTQYENAPMPWLYHRYAGHDINRDGFMLNLAESRSLASFFYTQWHPQVFMTMHQMGTRGPRFFVPPVYEPIDPNYDALLWRQAGLLGHAMSLELERHDRAGVISNALFDYYWPGYEDSAPLGHNTICLLAEVASARFAWPITVPLSELQTQQRGLSQYRAQQNFPNPWRGGVWRLRDIVEYNLTAIGGLLDGAARYREQILENFHRMGRRAIAAGEAGSPFAFIIPSEQHDPHAATKLRGLLIESAIEIHRADEMFRAGGTDYPVGTELVLMAQPFRAYAKTLLERQDYPARRLSPGGPPERPYDVAGWTLPFQMGVRVDPVAARFDLPRMSRVTTATINPATVSGERRPTHYLIDARGNGGAIAVNRLTRAGAQPTWTTAPRTVDGLTYPAGTIVVRHTNETARVVQAIAATLGLPVTAVRGEPDTPTVGLRRARIALHKPWVETIDEGWTRWLLEQYEFPFATVRDEDIRAGGLKGRFDAIVLADAAPEQLRSGHPEGTVPPEYTGGLGDRGQNALRQFVEDGGTLVALDSSGGLLIDTFDLPIVDIARSARPEDFFCPGSIIRLSLDPAHPLAFGMPEQTTAFFSYSSAYKIRSWARSTPDGHGGADSERADAQVVGRYGSKNLLLSGWLEGQDTIAGRPAVVEVRIGKGRVVLIGFRAQHRAQSHATFRLLFNPLLTATTDNTRP